MSKFGGNLLIFAGDRKDSSPNSVQSLFSKTKSFNHITLHYQESLKLYHYLPPPLWKRRPDEANEGLAWGT